MTFPPNSCTVTDGDTIRCGVERIRLLAIDAPELPGHCRLYRKCVAGDPIASMANLERLMRGKRVEVTRFGRDRYGRTLAIVRAGGRDVACAQIAAGAAVYVEKWDRAGKAAKACANGSDIKISGSSS